MKTKFKSIFRGGCHSFIGAVLGIALLAFTGGGALGQPAWYNSGTQSGIEPGSPDFYQHQTTENQANSGWCFYTAYEDAMYYDANNGFANLYPNMGNPNWVATMNNNLTTLINTPFGNPLTPANFMNTYIAAQGYGGVLGEATTANSGGGYSIYNAFTSDLLAGSNVLIYITQNTGVTNQWWGFHVMDAVGFSVTNHTIDVLDPDNNQYGGYGFPGTAANPPASGFYTNSYGVSVPYNLVDYNTNEPVPIENGFGDVGNPTNKDIQQYTVDANGNITSGIYAGTQINYLFAIGPVPEPSVFALGLAIAVVSGGYRLARRRKN
jgi:hypothetical protein